MQRIDGINLDTIDESRQRWVKAGGVSFRVKMVTPRELERFRRRLRDMGIVQHDREGRVRDTDEEAFRLEFARTFVTGWTGNITPEGSEYTPEKMASALANIPGLTEMLWESVQEYQSFFSRNGATPT